MRRYITCMEQQCYYELRENERAETESEKAMRMLTIVGMQFDHLKGILGLKVYERFCGPYVWPFSDLIQSVMSAASRPMVA